MPLSAIQTQLAQAGLWLLLSPLPLAQAQPDLKDDAEKCLHAQTPAQCDAALPSCVRVLGSLSQIPSNPEVDVVNSELLSHTAWCEKELGRYAQAEGHYRASLELDQRRYGTEHPEVASSLNNLGGILVYQGKHEAAETLFRQALQMRQKLLRAEHPDIAHSLNNLAGILAYQGKNEEAETLFRQALQIRQKVLGAEHLDVAHSLSNLAFVLDSWGKYEDAEMLARQALEIMQKLLGLEHQEVAVCLGNLAGPLVHQGKYEAAEMLYRQALEMKRRLLGSEHPDVAHSLDDLTLVLHALRKYDAAEKLSRQSLGMRQNLLGAEHPAVGRSLHSLALVIESQGKYKEAETWYRQALGMQQKLLGAEHPKVAGIFIDLTFVLIRLGNLLAAVPMFTSAAAIEEAVLRATSSENRMKSALDQVRSTEDALYGLLLDHPREEKLKRLVMTTALLRKGRTAEAGRMVNRLLHQSRSKPETNQRYEQWLQVRQQREALLYLNEGNLSPVEYQQRLRELRQQADDLEAQLAAAMPELRRLQLPKFDEILSAVAARLPKDGVLFEVVRAVPYNLQAKDAENPWKTPHYVALVMKSDQQIVAKDIGEAATVDDQIMDLLSLLRSPTSDPVQSAKALYEQVLNPVLPESAQHVYLSLDGALSLVPFDALHDGTDYLQGRKSFHYLTSGRDLLRLDAGSSKQAALVLADPDFGPTAKESPNSGPETFYWKLAGLSRLSGAQEEAKQIGPMLRVTPLVGTGAKESVVRATQAPWVLHIASHGLFLSGRALPRSAGLGGALFGNPFAERKGVLVGSFATEPMEMYGDSESLSRSALVLANAAEGAKAKSTAEDGLLTAEEARSLDLFGTQLVVLSACDTGRGELSVGQGVYGLRRAFLVAGAETLVTSLWQVSDSATGKLMQRYYEKLLKEKKGRLEGMREAMKEMRDKYKHPYYWAPFLVIGSDGPLRPPTNWSQP